MSKQNEPVYPLYQKAMDFFEEMENIYLPKYHKKERRFLVARTINALYDLIANIVQAQNDRRNRRHLQELIDANLSYIRALIAIARRKKCLTIQGAAYLQGKLKELGRILGGWIKKT